jgi:hypothetical protein
MRLAFSNPRSIRNWLNGTRIYHHSSSKGINNYFKIRGKELCGEEGYRLVPYWVAFRLRMTSHELSEFLIKGQNDMDVNLLSAREFILVNALEYNCKPDITEEWEFFDALKFADKFTSHYVTYKKIEYAKLENLMKSNYSKRIDRHFVEQYSDIMAGGLLTRESNQYDENVDKIVKTREKCIEFLTNVTQECPLEVYKAQLTTILKESKIDWEAHRLERISIAYSLLLQMIENEYYEERGLFRQYFYRAVRVLHENRIYGVDDDKGYEILLDKHIEAFFDEPNKPAYISFIISLRRMQDYMKSIGKQEAIRFIVLCLWEELDIEVLNAYLERMRFRKLDKEEISECALLSFIEKSKEYTDIDIGSKLCAFDKISDELGIDRILLNDRNVVYKEDFKEMNVLLAMGKGAFYTR